MTGHADSCPIVEQRAVTTGPDRACQSKLDRRLKCGTDASPQDASPREARWRSERLVAGEPSRGSKPIPVEPAAARFLRTRMIRKGERMRLVVVNHEYPPWGGGAATATEALSHELAALGHRVVVVTAGGPSLPELSGDERLRIWRIPTGRRSRFAPTSAELLSFCFAVRNRLSRCLTEVRADGVLAFFAVPAGYFAVRAAHSCGLPAIVSLRGSDVPGFSSSRLTGGTAWAAQRLIRQTLLEADLVAPNCPRLQELVVKWLPQIADKVRVVPNGVHRNEFLPEDRMPVASVSVAGAGTPRSGRARAGVRGRLRSASCG